MFNLIELTRSLNNEPIWFNPLHIVCLTTDKDGTRIETPDSSYNVKESPEQVTQKFRESKLVTTLDTDI